MSTLTTSTSDLGESRVRVDVEVATAALEREVASAAGEIGRDMKVPGFRKGKVPPQVVLQQVGREAVLDEAVRRALPNWYEEAVQEAGLATVGSPDVNLTGMPEKGAPLAFTFEVGVRPSAELGEFKGVEAARRDPEVAEDDVEGELDRMRESLASLETVDRAAADKDYVVIDFAGSVDGEPFEGGEARGFLLELGSGRLIPGFEEQLTGTSAGDEREVRVTFPEDYEVDHLAGKEASFAVEVKEVKEKRLPELDDDLAVEAGGYESLDDLREEIRGQLRTAQEAAIDRDYREGVVDAVAGQAKIDVPRDLVHEKAHEMWHMTARRLSQQGLDPQQYLQITGKTEEEVVTEAEPEAERALRREAALAAVIDIEGIVVSDDEIMEALREAAAQPGTPAPSDKALLRSLKKARAQGTDHALREDIAMRKAVDLLVEHAKPIPAAQAEAREELWTPEKEAGSEKPEELWTPGSD
ncbi:MAG: trigger factor [Actinomycetota bacterium]|nr:trigger factor [Thermoleophilaceae bacterium]MDQ3433500.1 trigger factor [Actinomycetota bacterium]